MAGGGKPSGVKPDSKILENSWKIFNVVQCFQEAVYIFIDAQYKLWSAINLQIHTEMCFLWWRFYV